MSTGRTSNRIPWLDAAKGAAILLVVIGHTLRGLSHGGLLTHTEACAFVDLRIYAFHMPMFFALAGVLFTNSLRHNSAWQIIWSRCRRLLYPLVLWTQIFVLCKIFAEGAANEPSSWSDLLVSPIPGRFQFWFLWALFVIQVSLILFKPIAKAKRVVGLSTMVVSCALSTWATSALITPYTSAALEFAPFFTFGMCIGAFREDLPRQAAAKYAAAAIFVAIMIAIPSDYQTNNAMRLAVGMTLTACALTILASLRESCTRRALCALGRASMAIYLTHTIFSAALRGALVSANIYADTPHILLGVIVGIFGPLGARALAARLGATRLLALE